ncbi:MAG: hypothetical protein Unbinned4311contig1001_42 [Prokaryotic dsDNA virus sp.]|nr:MAG: hypothetical protein Unbinned4311contig1001_42 [Prokaryotic dsDNA virus sp.]|tara:strand:- start:1063 stop:1746 length:684 start_codon:yes stop_codon:yes gene_type:complete
MAYDNKPSYFAVIPAKVRYDEDLPSGAKLLYGEISALCNERGYCWAENRYFANLYKVRPETISVWLGKLSNAGHINMTYVPVRHIYIAESLNHKKSNINEHKDILRLHTAFTGTEKGLTDWLKKIYTEALGVLDYNEWTTYCEMNATDDFRQWDARKFFLMGKYKRFEDKVIAKKKKIAKRKADDLKAKKERIAHQEAIQRGDFAMPDEVREQIKKTFPRYKLANEK